MSQYELGDLDNRVLSLLDENSLFYPKYQRYAAINESLKVINLASPFYTGTLAVPGFSVAGQLIYPVPAGFVFPLRAYFNGKQLNKVSLRSLTMRYRNFATELSSQGQPVQEWVPLGLGMFLLHPMDSLGGQTITINGVLEPPRLTVATQTITIEDDWIPTVVNLAFMTLAIAESAAEFASLTPVYQQVIRDLKKRVQWGTVTFGKFWLLQDVQKPGATDAT